MKKLMAFSLFIALTCFSLVANAQFLSIHNYHPNCDYRVIIAWNTSSPVTCTPNYFTAHTVPAGTAITVPAVTPGTQHIKVRIKEVGGPAMLQLNSTLCGGPNSGYLYVDGCGTSHIIYDGNLLNIYP